MYFKVLLSLKYYLYLKDIYYKVFSRYKIKEIIIDLKGYLF